MKFGCFGSFTDCFTGSIWKLQTGTSHSWWPSLLYLIKREKKRKFKKETFLMTIITILPDIDDHHNLSIRSLMTTIISSPDLLHVQLKRWKLRATPARVSNANRSHSRPSRPCRHLPSRHHCNVVIRVIRIIFIMVAMCPCGICSSQQFLLFTILKTGVSGNILLCMVILRKRLYRQEGIEWWAWFFLHLSWLWKYNVRVKPCSTYMQGYGV